MASQQMGAWQHVHCESVYCGSQQAPVHWQVKLVAQLPNPPPHASSFARGAGATVVVQVPVVVVSVMVVEVMVVEVLVQARVSLTRARLELPVQAHRVLVVVSIMVVVHDSVSARVSSSDGQLSVHSPKV